MFEYFFVFSKEKIDLESAEEVESAFGDYMSELLALLDYVGFSVNAKKIVWRPILVQINRNYMGRIINNLVSNIRKYGDNLEALGVAYKNARMGLVVPSYVTIRSIEELNEHKEKFRNEIIGIDVGAGLMNETERVIREYPVELTLKPSSGATMVAFLQKSIENKEWIVVTGWTPHWMFSRYDLKFLDDPQKQYGDAEQIQIMATKGFSDKDPYAAAFFRNFSLDNNQLGELMDLVEAYPMREEEGAKIWLSEHPEVNEFFPTFAEK